MPTDFAFSIIEEQLMSVGESEKQITISHSQQPCDYKIEYSATSLPSFVTFDAELKIFTFKTPSEADVGEYTIGIEA